MIEEQDDQTRWPCFFTAHALDRCFDRYGFIPTPFEECLIFLRLTDERCQMVRPMDENNVGVWSIWFRHTKMLLVYNPYLATVVTVLPPRP